MRPDHVFQFGLRFLGHYKNGHPSGHFWLGSYGGGNYHGTWGPDGTMTGDKMAFIYPDMNTAFLGRFDNYIMKSAKEVEVLDSGCDEYGMMIVTKFSEPSGPEFYYDPPTNESFGAGPPGVMDPFERKWVELTDSKVPGAGQGVFLKQKPLGEMYVSLYSGYLYDREQQLIYAQNCMDNITLTDEQRRHCKKYALGISYNGVQINIPEDHDAVGAYHPTLGPKVLKFNLVQSKESIFRACYESSLGVITFI